MVLDYLSNFNVGVFSSKAINFCQRARRGAVPTIWECCPFTHFFFFPPDWKKSFWRVETTSPASAWLRGRQLKARALQIPSSHVLLLLRLRTAIIEPVAPHSDTSSSWNISEISCKTAWVRIELVVAYLRLGAPNTELPRLDHFSAHWYARGCNSDGPSFFLIDRKWPLMASFSLQSSQPAKVGRSDRKNSHPSCRSPVRILLYFVAWVRNSDWMRRLTRSQIMSLLYKVVKMPRDKLISLFDSERGREWISDWPPHTSVDGINGPMKIRVAQI